jgi:hypothetical protein
MSRPPRQPVDLQAVTPDVRGRCARAGGNLEQIAQQHGPIFVEPQQVMLELVVVLHEVDLFIQPNDQPTIVRENLGTDMCEWYRAADLFGGADPVLRVVGRVERLGPASVHPMHGGSLPAHRLQGYTTVTYGGRLFGRHLPDGA